VIPHETGDVSEAMRRADRAMYAQKRSGRATAGRQSTDVLMQALAERHADLGEHQDGVAELAEQTGRRLGIDGEELTQLRHAAALHDIVGARIIAVCDAFDAMISDRSYAASRTFGEAVAELKRCAGTQFDPAIVAVFEQVIAERAESPTAGETT
jgi:HD-GYP domain-containing protein (c-di-GMP phosphodiesterase class II)